jgi:hypothetical protein
MTAAAARILVDGTFAGEVDTYSAFPELAEVFSAAGQSDHWPNEAGQRIAVWA